MSLISCSKPPQFSVIIPTFNRADLLPRAIQSVLNQSFGDFELLIVDDHSPDNTKSVVESFSDRRVRYVYHEDNKGAPATRNTGIAYAKGEYIAFLDDDDEYLPQFLLEMHQIFNGSPESIGFSWGGIRWIKDADGEELVLREEMWQPKFQNREHAYLSFLKSRRIGNSGLVVRKSCFDEVGLFDEQIRGGAEDTEFLIRLVRCFDFKMAPRVLIKVHLHAGSHLRSYSQKKAFDYERIIEKNKQALLDHPDLLASKHYKIAWLYYHGGNKIKARHYMRQALRAAPLRPRVWLTWLMFEALGDQGPILHRKLSSWKTQLFRKEH
jgi:glycosyltransferase involved in cell wall biosynthesis